MDVIQEQLRKPLVAGAVGFIVGLILGWMVLGWVVFPVVWTDASPGDLLQEYREDYLRMAIDSYDRTRDPAAAQRRWNSLGSAANDTLAAISNDPAASVAAIVAFESVIAAESGVPEEEAGGTPLWLYLCILVVLIGGGLVLGYLYLGRRSGGGEASVASQAAIVSQSTERTDYEALGEDPPIGQYMTTYMLGDDLFDDSFSIDSPGGEFLGECGVGIAETIGVGEPKRVSSYEIWVFDKNDIQTVTKVLMSENAFNDMATRERLAAKGEPVLAEADGQFILETETLRLVARVVDMTYGGGALPENSHFERMTLELAVWTK